MREGDQHSIQFGFQGSEDRLARQLNAFRAVARTTMICFHAGGSIFIILVGGESYAAIGASDPYVKEPKRPGGDAVRSFGDNLQQNNSIVWVQTYKVDLPATKQAKLSFLEGIAGERCKDLMHRYVTSTLFCLKVVTHKRTLLPINP